MRIVVSLDGRSLWLYVSVTGVVIYFLLYRIWKPQ